MMKNSVLFLTIIAILHFSPPKAQAVINYSDRGVHEFNSYTNDYIDVSNNTTLNVVAGGSCDWMDIWNAIVTIDGGTIRQDIWAMTRDGGSNLLTVSDGLIGTGIDSLYDSQVVINGGVILSGGLSSFGNSQIAVFGGSINGVFSAEDDSTITIYGTNFNYGYGAITISSGTLTGTLANGNTINNNFNIYDNASIFRVPEPGTMLLVCLGGFLLRKRS